MYYVVVIDGVSVVGKGGGKQRRVAGDAVENLKNALWIGHTHLAAGQDGTFGLRFDIGFTAGHHHYDRQRPGNYISKSVILEDWAATLGRVVKTK